MIIALYIVAAVIMAVGSLYFAWQNRDFRKFLAGAFFVSSGILFYLYLADVSVPLLGTSFVETPQISGGRRSPTWLCVSCRRQAPSLTPACHCACRSRPQ